ncbi:MAG: CsgG/HfaB family protein [bacterium]
MRSVVAGLLLIGGLCLCHETAMAQPRPLQKMQQKRKEQRAERLVSEGVTLMQNGKPAPAREKFEEALGLDPKNARAHANLAWLAWEDHREGVAQSHAEMALRIQPEIPRAHLVMANVLMKKGKDLAAFDHVRKAARYGNSADQAEATRLLSSLRTKHADFLSKSPSPPSSGNQPAPAGGANTSPPITTEKPLLAVFAFADTQLDTSEGKLGETLAEMLATSLINRGAYRVIERSQLDRLLQEQALGQTGALEAETVVVVGSLLGAQAVVVGSLNRPATAYEADARILSVSTGEAFAASHAQINSSAQLRDLAEALGHELSGKAGMIQVSVQKDSASMVKP